MGAVPKPMMNYQKPKPMNNNATTITTCQSRYTMQQLSESTPRSRAKNALSLFSQKLKWLAFVWLLMLGIQAQGQLYPVTLSVTGDHTLSGSISDIANGTIGNFTATIITNDLNVLNREVFLKISIKGNDINASTILDTYSENNILINGGEVAYLDKNEIKKYFYRDNLENISDDQFNMILPEGSYTFTFEVYDYNNLDKAISNPVKFNVLVSQIMPPTLISPCSTTITNPVVSAPITISWSSAVANGLNVAYELEYLIDESFDQDLTAGFTGAATDIETVTDIKLNLYNFVPYNITTAPPYRVIYRVKAIATSLTEGIEVNCFGENAYSNICWFDYKPEGTTQSCTEITGFEVVSSASGSSVTTLKWHVENETQGQKYSLCYKPVSGTGNPFCIQDIADTTYLVKDLVPGISYDFTVKADCPTMPVTTSEKSLTYTITKAVSPITNCGEKPLFDPLTADNLLTEDEISSRYIYIRGVPISIEKVDNTFESLLVGYNNYPPKKVGNSYTGYGRITFAIPLFQSQTPGILVKFKDLYIDKEYNVVAGYAETLYNPDNFTTQIADLNAFTKGGKLFEKIMTDDFDPNLEVKGVIGDATNIKVIKDGTGKPVSFTIDYATPSPTTGETEPSTALPTSGGVSIELSNNNVSESFNYYVIKDAENVYYGIDLKTGEVIPIGRYNPDIANILADIDINVINHDKKITFENGSGTTYAFDPANNEYGKNLLFSSFYILGNEKTYSLRWKFMPVGSGTDKVEAIMPSEIEQNKETLKFIVKSNSTEIDYTPNPGGNITLNLMPGTSDAEYSIHAVVKNKDTGKWEQAGRFDVLSRTPKTYNATLVALGGTLPSGIEADLNTIWKPYGITWKINVDDKFYDNTAIDDASKERVSVINGIVSEKLTAGDEFLSEYSQQQLDINRAYRDYLVANNKYSNEEMYLFVLPEGKAPDKNKLGDMPLGKQWGYLFGTPTAHTLAHELGHGKTKLEHTFADDKITQGSTTNLMDYSANDSLVRYQWQNIHDPAIFDPVQSDEDAAFSITIHQNLVIEALSKIEGKIDVNERNLKLLISTGLLADGGSILCEINEAMGNAELTEDLRVFLNSKLEDMLRIYNSPLNVLEEKWIDFWSTSIEFPNMRNIFRRSWQYGVEMKQSVDIFTEYWKIVSGSDVKFEKLVITPNNKFKIELQDLTLLENPDITFDLLFRMKDYVTISGDMKSLTLNGKGIDLFPEWITSDVDVLTKTDLSVQYVNRETHTNLFKVTFNLNASLVNSVELDMSLNGTPLKFPLTCEAERTEIHFDNMYNSTDVLGEWTKIDSKLAGIKNLNGDNPIDLGLVLHNVGDFYAHSNFIVEYLKWWMEEIKKPGYEKLSIKTLKPEDLPSYRDVITNASNPHKLNWGAFWNYYRPIMKTEAWTLGLMLDPSKTEGLSIDFHDEVALDGPDSKLGSQKPHQAALCNYHQFAVGAAYNHVYQILNDKLK